PWDGVATGSPGQRVTSGPGAAPERDPMSSACYATTQRRRKHMDPLARIDAIVERLQQAAVDDRDAIREELLAFCLERPSETVRQHLETARKGLSLELRWEIDEVLEALQPKAPEPEPEPEPEALEEEEGEDVPADGRLRMSDLK